MAITSLLSPVFSSFQPPQLQTPDLISSEVTLSPGSSVGLWKIRLKKGHDLNSIEAVSAGVLARPWRETEAKPEEENDGTIGVIVIKGRGT